MNDPDVAALGGSTSLPPAGMPLWPDITPALADVVNDGVFPEEVTL